jgi:hypothetical protein
MAQERKRRRFTAEYNSPLTKSGLADSLRP